MMSYTATCAFVRTCHKADNNIEAASFLRAIVEDVVIKSNSNLIHPQEVFLSKTPICHSS
jgi:hypothetical protein